MAGTRSTGTASGWRQRLAILVGTLSLGGVASAGERPNILFIFADDHSPKTLSCYEGAYPIARTPNLDALAASGVRFQAGYMGSWCMPSRATLLTGLHPHAIESMRMAGEYPGSVYDPELCRFWPSAFRQHGYQTAQIGKWHTGVDAGWGRDWDYQIVWNRPDNPDNASSYYGTQVLDFNGQRRAVEGYSTDNYTRWACDYIRGHGRDADRPWYLWLCYGAVHGPTEPAQRHVGLLADQTTPVPSDILGPHPGKPSYLARTQAWGAGPDGEPVMLRGGKSHTAWLQQVNECMLAIDEGVGALIEALRESGQLENTLVVYTSDQGFANGEHGMKQKVAPYEATYASPLIVSQPGTLPAGEVCRQTANGPDLVVTFFAQAGIPLPWPMHGRDITPLLLEPDSTDWGPTLYTHTGKDYGRDVTRALAGQSKAIHANVPYYAAVRYRQLKYVRYFEGTEPEELYDLDRDPEERHNRVDDPDYRNQLEWLRQQWSEQLAAVGADFVEPPPQD
jgi:arylsulfatase A-like enzyme